MTANDPWDTKLKPLRDASLMVPFNRLSERYIVMALKRICRLEGIECEDQALKLIAQRAEGDLRSAINDLQAIAEGYGKVTVDIVRSVLVSRDRQYSPWEMLRHLFMSKYAWQAKRAVTHADLDYETLLQWINENIPHQYTDIEDIWRAYEALARADIMLARTKRRSAWDLLAYVFDLAGPGVALARKKSKFKWAKYQYPQRILLLAKTKEMREIRNALAEAMSKRLLISKRRFITEVLPYMRIIFQHRPDYAARIAIGYNLTDNMVKLLAGENYSKVKDYMNKLLLHVATPSTVSTRQAISSTQATVTKPVTTLGQGEGTRRSSRRTTRSRRRRKSGSSGRQTTLF
jgi:replication factor C large subunit